MRALECASHYRKLILDTDEAVMLLSHFHGMAVFQIVQEIIDQSSLICSKFIMQAIHDSSTISVDHGFQLAI